MSKNRTASLLETFFSVLIFLVIIVISTQTLIFMNKRDHDINSLNGANECVRKILDVVVEDFQLADNTDSSIFPVTFADNNYKTTDLKIEPGNKGKYIGFISTEQVSSGLFKAKIILKTADQLSYLMGEKLLTENIESKQLLGKYFEVDKLKKLENCQSLVKNDPFEFGLFDKKNYAKGVYTLRLSDQITLNKQKITSRLFLAKIKIYE